MTIEQENESLKKQVEELLAKVEEMSKKETDLSYKLAQLSDEYKLQGARFKRETEKTKVSPSPPSYSRPCRGTVCPRQVSYLLALRTLVPVKISTIFRFMLSKILQKIYFQLQINLYWHWIMLKKSCQKCPMPI